MATTARVRSVGPLAGILALAAAVRLVLLRTPALALDGDEAVTGLLARRILDGHHRAYFPGQDYMGTLEQYLQAAVLWLLPDSAFVLRLPQVALATLSCVLVHRIALRCSLSPARALFAAAVFAVGPYLSVYWSVKSRGAYGVAMVLGLTGVLIALQVRPDSRGRLAAVGLFGVVCGLAFWNNQQAAYLLLPAGWWLLATVRRTAVRSIAVGAVGFVVGAAPALWHAAATGASLTEGVNGTTSIAERAQHLLTDTLPDALGTRDDGQPLVAFLPPSLVVLAAVLAVGAAVRANRHGILAVLTLRTEGRRGTDLLLLAVLVVPLLYVQSGLATANSSVRFVFVVLGIVPVLVAALPVPGWARRLAAPRELALLAVALAGVHTWIGAQYLIADFDDGHHVHTGQRIDQASIDGLLAAFDDLGIETAYADYWLAYRLDWEADGAVAVEALYSRRFPHLSAAVDADPSPALVLDDVELDDVRAALDGRGATYELTPVRGWWIVHGIDPGIHIPWVGSMAEAVQLAT